MKTPGQPPETFAQLLAKATPGPFGVSESGKSIWHGDPEEYLSVCHTSFETTEHTPADMELIARLLSFAHAGGFDAVGALCNYANDRFFDEADSNDTGYTVPPKLEKVFSLLETLNNPSK